MFARCLDEFIGKVVKLFNGVEDTRESELVQYKEYEIYLIPRQEGIYDVGIYKYGRSVNQVIDIHLSADEIVTFAKEWIDENEEYH